MKSEFNGGVFAYYFFNLLKDIVIILSLGFAYPAMQAVYLRWQTKHTVVNGQQLKFTGSAEEFYGRFLVMYALSLLTLGIYYVVKMQVELIKWEAAGVHAEDRMDFVSGADIKWYKLIGVNCLCNLVYLITLGIASPLIRYERTMWFCKHTYINGVALRLDGDENRFFLKCLLWSFLTNITLGIFGMWAAVKVFRLTVSYISFSDGRYVTERTIYLKPSLPAGKPDEPAVVLAPEMGETYAKVSAFLKLKRAMMCFVCEIPLLSALPALLYLIKPIYAAFYPLAAFAIILLSLPVIFLAEERHKSAEEINLAGCTSAAVVGIIFSASMPVFLPLFIAGLIKTNGMKEYLYADYKGGKLSSYGENFIAEEEQYFRESTEYRKYLWACKTYRKKYGKYAKSVLESDYGVAYARKTAAR